MDWTSTLLAIAGSFLFGSILGPYIASYVKKKGENRAVHEDMDKMTRLLEDIKSQFVSANAYSAEKAKGLATKEDIGDITRQVESVKSELSLSLEIVKLELSKKATVHRLAAEKEFQALAQIGEAMFDLRMVTQHLRPQMDQIDPNEPVMDRHNRRYAEYCKAHDTFMLAYEKKKLFIPRYLYSQFVNIRNLAHKESVGFEYAVKAGKGDLNFEAYQQGAKNVGELLEAIDTAITSMRKRYATED